MSKVVTTNNSSKFPNGFWSVFFIQMLSTLSFAVLYSTLVLYMKNKLGFSSQTSNIITGVYFAYNFTLHLLAGFLGGRFFSYRSLIIVGLIFQGMGCTILIIPSINHLYIGLACMLIGTGTMVTCINMLITQLFTNDHPLRETGFLWNYSSMNIGFTLGLAIAGWFQLLGNYTLLFGITSLINVFALILIIAFWKKLEDKNTAYILSDHKKRKLGIGILIVILLIPTLYYLLQHQTLSDTIVLSIGVIMLLFMLKKIISLKGADSKKMAVFVILILAAQLFFIVCELAPMGLTFFAVNNVNRELLGITIQPGWIQSINSITIIIAAPILGVIFNAFKKRNKTISIPLQFFIGLCLTWMGIFLLPIGIHFANTQGYTSFIWLAMYYVFLAIAELCISPIGFSMVGKLIPVSMQSLMMGIVLLNTGVAAVLASFFSNYAMGNIESTNPLITNQHYSHSFSLLATVAFCFSLLLFLLIPILNRWQK